MTTNPKQKLMDFAASLGVVGVRNNSDYDKMHRVMSYMADQASYIEELETKLNKSESKLTRLFKLAESFLAICRRLQSDVTAHRKNLSALSKQLNEANKVIHGRQVEIQRLRLDLDRRRTINLSSNETYQKVVAENIELKTDRGLLVDQINRLFEVVTWDGNDSLCGAAVAKIKTLQANLEATGRVVLARDSTIAALRLRLSNLSWNLKNK